MCDYNSILWISRIKEHYDDLSKSERIIADYLLNNPKSVHKFSSHELSNATGVSAATIVRFCRSIGFNGYSEFKLYVKQEKLELLEQNPEILSSDSLNIVKQKTAHYNSRSLSHTMSIISDEMLSKAVDAIIDANQVIIAGFGGSGNVARCAYDAFLQLDIPCCFIEDPTYQIIAVSKLKPGDVLLAICYPGKTIDLVDTCKIAKSRGVTIIGLIGVINSPLAKLSDIILQTCTSNNMSLYSSTLSARISEIGVVSTLYSLILIKRNLSDEDISNQLMDLYNIKRTNKL